MSGKKKQLFRSWFCRIEHEIMLPFVTVGILVVCAFCAISVYNGYTEKLKDRKEYAKTTIRGMEADIYYLQGKLSEEEIRQKYSTENEVEKARAMMEALEQESKEEIEE